MSRENSLYKYKYRELCRAIEDIKSEIRELIDWHDCPIELDNGNDAWYCEACNRALEIIDRHIGDKKC